MHFERLGLSNQSRLTFAALGRAVLLWFGI